MMLLNWNSQGCFLHHLSASCLHDQGTSIFRLFLGNLLLFHIIPTTPFSPVWCYLETSGLRRDAHKVQGSSTRKTHHHQPCSKWTKDGRTLLAPSESAPLSLPQPPTNKTDAFVQLYSFLGQVSRLQRGSTTVRHTPAVLHRAAGCRPLLPPSEPLHSCWASLRSHEQQIPLQITLIFFTSHLPCVLWTYTWNTDSWFSDKPAPRPVA